MSGAFIDAVCTKCNTQIGWFGTMANKPACRKCGYREDQATLDAREKRMQEYLDKAHREHEARDDAEWKASTPEDRALYAEGQDAADKAGTRGKRKTLPLDVPSPYTATKTPDGKFWDRHHHWWLWGWRDAEWNRDRRTT